jgi:release factor glutamine methyltransferase
LVDAALELVGETGRAIDLGTGSGALLLALLANRAGWQGVGVDASAGALAVAAGNAAAVGLADRSEWRQRDWNGPGWSDDLGTFDLVLCNPPYIEVDAKLDPGVRDYEPATALFAGKDGLDDYRAIIPQLGKVLVPGGFAIFEIGASQAEGVSTLMTAAGFTVALRRDLAGRPRALILR